MCQCDPTCRTPYCGKGDCQWPPGSLEPEPVPPVPPDPLLRPIGEAFREMANILKQGMACVKKHHDELPRWRRRPSCPGRWLYAFGPICLGWHVDEFSADDIAHDRRLHGVIAVFGPIPELPHPMLCFQHGGSKGCERVNDEFGFTCPECKRQAHV